MHRILFSPPISQFKSLKKAIPPIAVGFMACICLLPAASWSDQGLSEEDFFTPPPKTHSATLLRQPLDETPTAVTIIDREMIEASGFIHIVDLLRLVPGFQIGLSGLDHVAVASYHGHSNAFPRRMQVLVDGRSIFGSVVSNIDWDDIGVQMADIDRIEVIRGPNTTVYGANAFSAVIHIITKPAFADKTFFDQTVRGSLNTRNHVMRYVNQNQLWDYRLTLHDNRTDGFPDHNDESQVAGGDFRATHQLDQNQSLDIQTGYSDGPMGRAGDTFEFRGIGFKQVTRNYQSVKWSRSFADDAETSFSLSQHYRREDDYGPVGTLASIDPGVAANFNADHPGYENTVFYSGGYNYAAQRTDAQWRYISNQEKRLVWVAGIDGRVDRLRSINLINHTDWVSNNSLRFSANSSFRITRSWLVQLGAMREFSSLFPHTTSWRLAMNYHLTNHQSIRFSLTRGYRLPSLLEEYFDFGFRYPDGQRIDTIHYTFGGLLPERTTNREIGYHYQSPRSHYSMDVKVFREQIDDEIEEVLGLQGAYRQYPQLQDNYLGITPIIRMNTGTSYIKGTEAEINYMATRNLSIHTAYAFAVSEISGSPDSVRSGRKQPAVPRHTYSVLLAYKPEKGYRFSTGVYRQTTMSWWGDGDDVLDHVRQDVTASRHWQGRHLSATLDFILQNIGESYREFSKFNVFETQAYIRLSIGAE